MNSDRIKEIQKTTAYSDSVSVQQALLQVWNECEQEKSHLKNDEPKQGTSLKCGCGGNLVWMEDGYVCDVCG